MALRRRLGVILFLVVFINPGSRAETDMPSDPVREMLLAHYQTVERDYQRLIKKLTLPVNLGLNQADLLKALEALQYALLQWKIEFHSGFAAFAVQSSTHLLAVNPQSMPSILEDDDDVLLHESVHLSTSQIQRQLYGLHSELIFFEWVQDHLDEERASRAEDALKHTLTPDDILRLKLWTPSLQTNSAPFHALEQAFRTSWICETQAYYVQMLAFDRQLKQQGPLSLKQTADMLRKTLVSETGIQLKSEDDMVLTIFQSFDSHRVSEGFQEAVLSCVMMDAHKELLFKTLAEISGWDPAKAAKDAAYRRKFYQWARQTVLRWNSMKTESLTLNADELKELRQNGLIAADDKNQT